MLLEKPIGSGPKEMAMWKRLKPLQPQHFIRVWKTIAPDEPIDWAFKPLIEKQYQNAEFGDTMVYGQ